MHSDAGPKKSIIYWVYVLKSMKDSERYIGYTNNLKERIKNIWKVKYFPHDTEGLSL